jgi:hypothetical protein
MGRSLDRLTLLLGIAAMLLAGALWFAATRPIATTAIADTQAASVAISPGATERVQLGPLAAYPETLKRPLIEPTRRPALPKTPEVARPREGLPPTPPPRVATPPPPVDGLKLLGIVKSGREPFRALVRAREGDAGQWVVEGGALGAWRVISIGDSRVVLEAQGHRVELAMFAAPKPVVQR